MEPAVYFQRLKGYFWNWEEDTSVLAISGGSTICYRDFAMQVLTLLYPQGLPPFGSLLLALIATNSTYPQDRKHIYSLVKQALFDDRSGTALAEEPEPLHSGLSFLDTLAELPDIYKTGQKRLLVLQTIFAGCHNLIASRKADGITGWLSGRSTEEATAGMDALQPFNPNVYFRDFQTLSLLHDKFPSAQSILQKIADLPDMASLPLEWEQKDPTHPLSVDFVQELMEHEKTFHVGALIQRVWSGLQIPFHTIQPSPQRYGGVSDLTNKGDFDKLLISEFANDDLVFLSRLANQEALYIQRETPPAPDKRQRVILIDSSLNNWGTPRTIAFALMMAIAKHPKTDIQCTAYAIGKGWRPLHYDSIDELIQSLQQLDDSIDCSEGLAHFLREEIPEGKTEIIFITAPEALNRPAVQKVMSEHHHRFRYWMTPDAEGRLAIYTKQHNSRKLLQEIILPLKTLWATPVQRRPRQQPEAQEEYESYPILFPNPSNFKKILVAEDGEVYKITGEKAIFRLYKPKKQSERGWELLFDRLPPGQAEYETGRMETGELLLLCYNVQNRELTIINLATGESRSVSFGDWQSSIQKNFFFYKDAFYYLRYDTYWMIEYGPEIRIGKQWPVPGALTEAYKLRMEQLREGVKYEGSATGVLKNVQTVFINNVHNLVFNIHELRNIQHSAVKLERTGFMKEEIKAVNSGKGLFSFPDGSTVTVNRSGMLILKSSNPEIADIYIPSIVDKSLGLATAEHFTGISYYYPDNGDSRVIDIKDFFGYYVDAFINNIRSYGNPG